jgi:hypothetical protein
MSESVNSSAFLLFGIHILYLGRRCLLILMCIIRSHFSSFFLLPSCHCDMSAVPFAVLPISVLTRVVLRAQNHLLRPLFSSSPSNYSNHSTFIYCFPPLIAGFIVSYLPRLRRARWQIFARMAGVNWIVSDGIVSVLAIKSMEFGSIHGVLLLRFLLEGMTMICITLMTLALLRVS